VTQARTGLLTGQVGVGKTTVAMQVISQATKQGVTCGGLLTPAILDSNRNKVGIWGVDILTGERRVMARTDRDLGGPVIGPYSFEATAFTWATEQLEKAVANCDLLVVDEIGKLELWYNSGLASFLPILASGGVESSLVLVRSSLLMALQKALGTVHQIVFRVNEENRAHIAHKIVGRLIQ
jgi:nucleoside-triphosphatase THEP1